MATLTFPSAMNQFVATLRADAVAKLDATHYVVVWNASGGGASRAVVCSISGTTITLGTPNTFIAAGSENVSVCGLDSTHFVVFYRNNDGSGYEVICGVTDGGTVISSYGTAVNVVGNSSSQSGGPQSIAMLDSTHFVVSYYNNNDTLSYCRVGSVSGTTITLGTANSFSGNPASGLYQPIAPISSSSFFVCFNNGGNDKQARVASVSGTTITYGTASTFNNDTHSSNNIASFPIDSTHIGVTWISGGGGDGGAIYVVIGVISGTTISSWGTATSVGVTAANGANLSAASIDASNYILAYTLGSNSRATASLGTISGTTPTLDTGVEFDTEAIDTSIMNTASTALLDSTHFVQVWKRGTSVTGQSIIGLVSTAAGPANLKSLNTNLKANIKSYNTNLIANVKSINTNA